MNNPEWENAVSFEMKLRISGEVSVKMKVSGISEKLLDRERFHFLESNIVIIVDVRGLF